MMAETGRTDMVLFLSGAITRSVTMPTQPFTSSHNSPGRIRSACHFARI
jgi:hypothetical protein